jgi:hypothetical protein
MHRASGDKAVIVSSFRSSRAPYRLTRSSTGIWVLINAIHRTHVNVLLSTLHSQAFDLLISDPFFTSSLVSTPFGLCYNLSS